MNVPDWRHGAPAAGRDRCRLQHFSRLLSILTGRTRPPMADLLGADDCAVSVSALLARRLAGYPRHM
jgi:hypothetical protein